MEMATLKRILLRIVAGIILLAGTVYSVDYLSLRFRIPPSRQIYGTVVVQPMYEIHEKNNKIEYDYKDPEVDPCVNSLFPHFGYPACWYLRRHTEKRIEI